jgi:outer membrane protein TolC
MPRTFLIWICVLALRLPARAEAPAPLRVGVRDAIASAIATNLSMKLALAEDEAARGRAMQAASYLLPSVLGTASQTHIFKENLAAVGLTGQQLPFAPLSPLIGPYNSFDARFTLTQTLFDLAAIKRYRAAGAGKDLALAQEALSREQVAQAAALAYIEAVRARKSVAAAEADAVLADQLLTQTQDQHRHGVVTGVDVIRAKTRLSDSRVNLIRAEVNERQAVIRLERVAGWRLSQPLELADDLVPGTTAIPPVVVSLASASADRVELRFAGEQLRVDEELLAAARGERAPVLSATGNWGLSGNQPGPTSAGTGSIGGSISLPIFTGGAISGRIREAKAHFEQSSARLADTRLQVEEDVRLAYETLAEAAQEVSDAAATVDLAQQELNMTLDQYKAGTADYVSVTTAQNELARARDSWVAALARDQDAHLNLAAAVGRAQSFAL